MELFKYEDKQVRTKVINDEVYFVGKDVADILGYSNTAKAIRDHVDDEDKRTERIVHPIRWRARNYCYKRKWTIFTNSIK